MSKPVFHPLRVASVEPLTDDSVALTFAVPPELADDYRFVHGQHLTIRGDDGERRSFSICTTPRSGLLRIGVKKLPGGAFSEGVVDTLHVGDELDVMTPAGRFTTTLDPASTKTYVAIAAGSGITPVISIVSTILESEPEARVMLVYANRTHRTVMFLDDLHDLKDRFPERFWLVHVLSREEQDVELFSGRLDGERLTRILDALMPADDVDEWFLCGPQQMVVDLRQVILDHGVEPTAIHTELFHADPVARAPEVVASGVDGRGSRHHQARRAVLRPRPPARRRGRARGGAAGAVRPAVRLPRWRVRHLSGQARRGDGGDGRQLRPRARGDRGRLRPHLPVTPDVPRVVLDYDA